MFKIGLGAGVVKGPSHLTADLLACPASFVVWGSNTEFEREGNPDPTYYYDEETGASYNAIGLKNSGSEKVPSMFKEMARLAEEADKKLRISLAPTGPGSLRKSLMRTVITPLRTALEYELNAACPNHREGDHLHEVLACDPQALRELLEETHGFQLMSSQTALKIAPDTDEDMLRRTIDLCIEFDIGGLVSSNTRKVPAPVVDGKPMISVDFCGQAGAPLLEDGLKQMATLAKIRKERGAKLKLTACGGISEGVHAKRYEEAGADEAQVVTGFLQFGGRVFEDIYIGM